LYSYLFFLYVDVVKRDDVIHIHLTFKLRGDLIELVPLTRTIQSKEDLMRLERMTQDDLESKLSNVIKQVQEIEHTDGLGIGDYVRAKYPDYFEQIVWTDQVKDLEVDVTVQLEVSRIGVIK
jgi:spore germination protein KC